MSDDVTGTAEDRADEQFGGKPGIAFSIDGHPITGRPVLKMIVSDGQNTVSLPIDSSTAVNVAGTISQWGNWLFSLEQSAKIMEAQQAPGGLVVPKGSI